MNHHLCSPFLPLHQCLRIRTHPNQMAVDHRTNNSGLLMAHHQNVVRRRKSADPRGTSSLIDKRLFDPSPAILLLPVILDIGQLHQSQVHRLSVGLRPAVLMEHVRMTATVALVGQRGSRHKTTLVFHTNLPHESPRPISAYPMAVVTATRHSRAKQRQASSSPTNR